MLDKLCSSKAHGGLGFRNIHVWDVASMGKYVWIVAHNEDNLWVK